MRTPPNRAWRVGALLAVAVVGTTFISACGPRWKTTHTGAPTTIGTPIPNRSTTTAAPVNDSTSTVPAESVHPADGSSATSSASPQASTSSTAEPTSVATSSPINPVDAVALITTNWERFFAATSSIDDRVALLEDGESLRAALTQRAQDPLMGQATASVDSVELTGADRATVTYDVLLSGNVVLPKAQGTAVLQDGVWKVGSASFCALIALGATSPLPGC